MKVRFRSIIPDDYAWLCSQMTLNITSDTTGFIAFDGDTYDALAAFVCQDWTPTSVQVHQVILKTMVLRHGYLEECADYIFNKAGRLMMLGVVPANNKQALSINKKIGFTEKARIEDAYDVGVDYVLMELKRDNCKYWIPAKKAA